MTDTVAMTVRLPAAIHEAALDLANQIDRSMNWLVKDAIWAYLHDNDQDITTGPSLGDPGYEPPQNPAAFGAYISWEQDPREGISPVDLIDAGLARMRRLGATSPLTLVGPHRLATDFYPEQGAPGRKPHHEHTVTVWVETREHADGVETLDRFAGTTSAGILKDDEGPGGWSFVPAAMEDPTRGTFHLRAFDRNGVEVILPFFRMNEQADARYGLWCLDGGLVDRQSDEAKAMSEDGHDARVSRGPFLLGATVDAVDPVDPVSFGSR